MASIIKDVRIGGTREVVILVTDEEIVDCEIGAGPRALRHIISKAIGFVEPFTVVESREDPVRCCELITVRVGDGAEVRAVSRKITRLITVE